MNSWDKSDSHWENYEDYIAEMPDDNSVHHERKYMIGDNDLILAQKLIRAGSEHRKFMRQIFVSVDITAPLYWWKEFDTYKVGTVVSSTSTMHKLANTPITLDCFEINDYAPELCVQPTDLKHESPKLGVAYVSYMVDVLECLRKRYVQTQDKRCWKELIRWLPESYFQTRTVTMSYENIINMVKQRKNHKLNEWSGRDDSTKPNFISWARSLPYARELIFIDETEGQTRKDNKNV